MLLNERRQAPVSSRFPGAGHPVYSDYNSVTVSLAATFAQQKGKLTIAAAAADFLPCDRVIIDFKVLDKRTSKDVTKCPCDFAGRAEIIVPTPAPANLAAYVASQLRLHSILSSNAVTAVTGPDMVWTMLRAGYELEFTAVANDKGKKVTLTPAITTPSATGSIPSIASGPAVWMHPTVTSKSPMRSRVGTLGWLAAPAGSKPRFLGVLRKEDDLQDYSCDCTRPPRETCHTAIVHGAVEVELEVAITPTTWPVNPVVAARHTADPAVNGGKVGGYRIVEAGAAPAGMSILNDVDIWDAVDTKAIIYLT